LASLQGCSSSPIKEDQRSVQVPSDGGPPPADKPACGHDAGASSTDAAPADWPAPGELHLTGAADAVNLALDADGTFRAFLFGCDVGTCAAGIWRADGDAVTCLPADGEATFDWPSVGPASSAEIVRDSATTLQVRVVGLQPVTEIWEFGLICAECCTGLGPSALYLCDEPLPLTCPK
jgi:hypothetical protein